MFQVEILRQEMTTPIVHVGIDLAKNVFPLHGVDEGGHTARVRSSIRHAGRALQRAQLQWMEIECHIAWCEERITAQVRSDVQARSAAQLCGTGPATASALVASVGCQKAVVVLANKYARILGAVLARGRSFDPNHVSVKPGAIAGAVTSAA